MTVEPRTAEALGILAAMDEPSAGRWKPRFVRVESEARAAALREVAEKVRRLPRFGVVAGSITSHHRGTVIRLDDVTAILSEATTDMASHVLGASE